MKKKIFLITLFTVFVFLFILYCKTFCKVIEADSNRDIWFCTSSYDTLRVSTTSSFVPMKKIEYKYKGDTILMDIQITHLFNIFSKKILRYKVPLHDSTSIIVIGENQYLRSKIDTCPKFVHGKELEDFLDSELKKTNEIIDSLDRLNDTVGLKEEN